MALTNVSDFIMFDGNSIYLLFKYVISHTSYIETYSKFFLCVKHKKFRSGTKKDKFDFGLLLIFQTFPDRISPYHYII